MKQITAWGCPNATKLSVLVIWQRLNQLPSECASAFFYIYCTKKWQTAEAREANQCIFLQAYFTATGKENSFDVIYTRISEENFITFNMSCKQDHPYTSESEMFHATQRSHSTLLLSMDQCKWVSKIYFKDVTIELFTIFAA